MCRRKVLGENGNDPFPYSTLVEKADPEIQAKSEVIHFLQDRPRHLK